MEFIKSAVEISPAVWGVGVLTHKKKVMSQSGPRKHLNLPILHVKKSLHETLPCVRVDSSHLQHSGCRGICC